MNTACDAKTAWTLPTERSETLPPKSQLGSVQVDWCGSDPVDPPTRILNVWTVWLHGVTFVLSPSPPACLSRWPLLPESAFLSNVVGSLPYNRKCLEVTYCSQSCASLKNFWDSDLGKVTLFQHRGTPDEVAANVTTNLWRPYPNPNPRPSECLLCFKLLEKKFSLFPKYRVIYLSDTLESLVTLWSNCCCGLLL